MELDTVIKKRRSIRSFVPKKPSWKLILEAIDSANKSPFAGNKNNLSYMILENPQTINTISDLSEQSWISESKILVLVCSDDTHLENLYGERGRVYSRQQAGASIQSLLLKLVDLGLDACWVGAYSDETIKQKLKIPQHIQIEAIIPIGYAYQEHKRRKIRKKELENSIRWENWNNHSRPPMLKEPEDNSSLLK